VGLVCKTRLWAPAEPRLGGFSLGVLTRLTLPTGDPASFVGEGSASFETRVLAEYAGRFASAHGTLGLLLRGDLAEPCPPSEPGSCVGATGHELPWGASVMVKPAWLGLDRAERVRLFVAAKGAVPLWPQSVDRVPLPASLGVSARVRLGDAWLLAGVEVGLTAGLPAVRSVLGLTFAPTGRDSDGDGLTDELDACPLRPEDRDGHQDDDGCPDLDDDQDRVPDALDACPREAEDLDGHDDDDGCPEPARGHGNSGDAEARPRYPSAP
jgi:hypothetical protein